LRGRVGVGFGGGVAWFGKAHRPFAKTLRVKLKACATGLVSRLHVA